MILVRDEKVVIDERGGKKRGGDKGGKKEKKSGHEWKRGIIKYNIHNEDTESGRKRGVDGARAEEAYR